MELIAVAFMIVAGGVIAFFVMIAAAIARREGGGDRAGAPSTSQEAVAASLLFQLLTLGGARADDAMRDIRRAGVAAPVTVSIDVPNWSAAFAERASAGQRAWLLETAVKLIVERGRLLPVRQYAALLDLSFGLGFQTDALAHLRERYRFDYVDHAKERRPCEADRAGRTTLFARDDRNAAELLRVLGLEGSPTRQVISASYRRLAAQHHPDRFHDASAEERALAAARFIEITKAYEALLLIFRE